MWVGASKQSLYWYILTREKIGGGHYVANYKRMDLWSFGRGPQWGSIHLLKHRDRVGQKSTAKSLGVKADGYEWLSHFSHYRHSK
jgi:hypothetical protein